MSRFVLVGARRFPPAELSPGHVGLSLAQSMAFVASMRRWQLLDSHATSAIGVAEADQPRTILLLWSSCPAAAASLAAAWSRVTGFEVSAWPLVDSRRVA
jgi:hypothetical protein